MKGLLLLAKWYFLAFDVFKFYNEWLISENLLGLDVLKFYIKEKKLKDNLGLVGIYALRVYLCTRFVKGDQLGSLSSIYFVEFHILKKKPSIRVVQLLYNIVYTLLYFYTWETNFVFFLPLTQVSCFVVTVP